MKKALSLLFVFVLVAALLSGCSSAPNADMTEKNVKKTVNVAFQALKDFDIETLETYVKSSALTNIFMFAKDHEQFADLGRAIFANLSYEIVEIDLEPDAETVTLLVTNKDLTQAASDFTDDLLSDFSLFELLAKLSDDAWLDENLSALTKSIAASELNPTPTEITLRIRNNGDNLVLRFNSEAEDAVSGGAMGAIMGFF